MQQYPMQQQYPAPMAPFHCRACGFAGHAMVSSKVSTGGWVVMCLLLLLCLPLFWIPLLAMKDRLTCCPNCRAPA